MDELCPLCLKIGSKKKIKAVQVNLTEAVWMCENEECPWPFGYENPSIFTRKVGEKWSFEWQIYRKLKKSIGPIPVSTELSLYTPPVTPSGDGVAKDSTKTDLSEATSTAVSICNNDVPKNNSVPGDSYAPISPENGLWLPTEYTNIAGEHSTSTKVATSPNNSESAAQGSSIIPSIFDIDGGDDLFGNKIGTSSSRSDTRSSKSPECATPKASILDVKNSEPVDDRADTVLNTSPKSETSTNKSLEIKKTVIGTSVNTDHTKVPFVRSIKKTNIDLQRFVSPSIVKQEKVHKIEKTESWIDAQPVTPPSDFDDRTNNHKLQHTTTITVDGIPPITLSYDLADLGERSETITSPLTSTPMQKGIKRDSVTSGNNVNEDKSEITTELPKKQSKISINRRTAKGKRYEKFSFSALRKNVQETKECNEKLIVSVNEETAEEVKHVLNSEREDSSITKTRLESSQSAASGTVVKGIPIITSGFVESNSPKKADESLISVNLDPNISLANDSRSVESLNLSLLDDMLFDGYQNATKNLNDDWLESFFT